MGKSGPKVRAKAVTDGEQVEIPVPHINRTVGTQKDKESWEWKDQYKCEGYSGRKNRLKFLKHEQDRNKVGKFLNPYCQEKPL